MNEKVMDLLEKEADALDIMAINDRLGLTTVEELRELQEELDKLVKDLVVYHTKKKKYILYSKCTNFKKGKIQVTKSGNGFLLQPGEEDVFIDRDDMHFALNGDTVLVELTKMSDKSPEGRVIKILERDLKNIVGTIKSDGTSLYFEPKNKLDIQLTVDAISLKSCVEGEIVVVSITDDLGKNRYLGSVAEHVCHKDDPTEDILTIAAEFDIFEKFPEDALEQANACPVEITGELLERELKTRKDLRDETIFTIDGKDTKDIDDAISLVKEGDFYILKVSIADVSYYVPDGSPLDLEARKRGTSSYLADSVIPMLPHVLSNGICSLNPNVARCALTCEMKLDTRGKVVDSNIYPSIIRSCKKMNYTDVNSILEDNIVPEGYEDYADILKTMQELAHLIRANRQARGASDFDVPEAKIICDENSKAIDVQKRLQREAEKLIEDFMIIANETVAELISGMGVPGVYRVHQTPTPEKVQMFLQFCELTGHSIKGKFTGEIKARQYKSILDQIKKQGDEAGIYRAMAVRTMPKAYYDTENYGHFGLASRNYTHFTSPIRRYPDLVTHRLLRTYLVQGDFSERTIRYLESVLPEIVNHASEREIAATEAERKVTKVKMAEYMEDHIGEEYDAVIVSVMGMGLFVQLDNLVEGLVSIHSLKDDLYDYDEARYCLIGKNTKKMYSLGDTLHIKCVAANKALGQIDFEVVKEDAKKLTLAG